MFIQCKHVLIEGEVLPWRGALAQGQCSWYHAFNLNPICLQTGRPPDSRLSHLAPAKLHGGAAGIQAPPDHHQGPSPAAGPNGAPQLLSFCAWTRCRLRRAIDPKYNSAWQSLILPLGGSVRSSPPSTVATTVQEINVAVEAFIYLAAVPQTRPVSANCERGPALALTGALTDTSDNSSTFLQTNFCLWLLNETQKKSAW